MQEEFDDDSDEEGEHGAAGGYDESDEEDDHAANEYFSAERGLRKRGPKAKRRALVSLKGGEAKELAGRVHGILQGNLNNSDFFLKDEGRALRRKYSEWHSSLHCGCSVLLHGFGSKRHILRDFASSIVHSTKAPVIVLEGSASGVRVRDLLLALLSQVLHVKDLSGRSNALLVTRIRAAFALYASDPFTKASPAHVTYFRSHFDELLPEMRIRKRSSLSDGFDDEALTDPEDDDDFVRDTGNEDGVSGEEEESAALHAEQRFPTPLSKTPAAVMLVARRSPAAAVAASHFGVRSSPRVSAASKSPAQTNSGR